MSDPTQSGHGKLHPDQAVVPPHKKGPPEKKLTGYENASKDNYMFYPKDGSPPRILGPRKKP